MKNRKERARKIKDRSLKNAELPRQKGKKKFFLHFIV